MDLAFLPSEANLIRCFGCACELEPSRCHCGAEKFEAMLKRGVAKSRMQGFYNPQVVSSSFAFDGKILMKNIPESGHRIACERHAARLYAQILRRQNKKRHWTAFCAFCAKNAT
jgi:hypothetical protein